MTDRMAPATEERSLGELFRDLTTEVTTLVRQEVTLARTELSEKVARVGRDAGMVASGVAIAYAGVLALVASIIAMLANVMPWWAAALVVGLVVAGAGAFMVKQGLEALKREDLTPRQTIES